MTKAEEEWATLGHEFSHTFKLVLDVLAEVRSLRRSRRGKVSEEIDGLVAVLREQLVNVWVWQDTHYEALKELRGKLSGQG